MRRDRKVILICDSNPVTVSILRFVLQIRRAYIILEASCAYEAIETIQFARVHVLLTNYTLLGSGGDDLARRVKATYGDDVKVILYSEDLRVRRRPPEVIADDFIFGSMARLGPLLETVRLLARRKRGPKKVFGIPFPPKVRQAA